MDKPSDLFLVNTFSHPTKHYALLQHNVIVTGRIKVFQKDVTYQNEYIKETETLDTPLRTRSHHTTFFVFCKINVSEKSM